LGDLHHDHECLNASHLVGQNVVTYSRRQKAILSVKFSLNAESSTYATEFALAMKKDPFLWNFETFNPNTGSKPNCDEKLDYTSMNNPCRGTSETCKFADSKNVTFDENGNKKPGETSCWRYSFRFHQEVCKATNGFMIQVEEKGGLGAGQKMETEMAKQVGMKVFRTYADWSEFRRCRIKTISKKIKEWYDSDCKNMDLENVYMGCDNIPKFKRPA